MRNILLIFYILMAAIAANAQSDNHYCNPPPTNSIKGELVWSQVTYHFSDDLYIEPGAQLTLERGSILRFGKGKKIIVNAGATIIIDGSRITNLDINQPWQGIEVWGDYTKSQYPDAQGNLYQGKAIIRNGSVIENARIAVLAGRLAAAYDDNDPGTPIPVNGEYNGGIITAHSSEFLNNQVGIYLPPYENFHPANQEVRNNMSYIKNCDFNITSAVLPAITAEAFVKLIGVRGISLHGNHFIAPHFAEIITGILSLNSSFEVKEYCLDEFLPCQNYRLSRFVQLRYGIRSLGSATAKSFSIDTAHFVHNITGIYISAIDNFSVTRSLFDKNVGAEISEHLGGLYIENPSAGFQVEENHFIGQYTGGQVSGKMSIGVSFNNTGEYNNELYNNKFENLNVGTLAMNINRSELRDAGLCIKCNDYSQNEYDILVNYDEALYSWGGIAPNQGGPGSAPDAPAGNLFSHAGDASTPTDINNQGSHIKYYYHANADEELVPLYYTGVTPVANYDAPWNAQSCPSNLTPPGGGHDEEALRGMMVEAEQQADSTQNLINILKDAGDTEALHWDVSMSAPWQSIEVYSELMSVSPYVSDTVLGAAIEKENMLVDAMIRDVLVANPHSAKSDAMMEKLDQRIQPLPEYMLDEILQGQSLVSVFENLQAGLAHSLQQQAQYQKQLVQLYLNDIIQPAAAADSLVSLLLASAHPAHWYRAAFLRHEQGNTAASADILNSIPVSFNLSAEQLQSHNQLASWLEQENLLQYEGKSLAVPDSIEVSWLFDLMETGNLPASIYARNTLLAHGLVEHHLQYLLPDDAKSSKAKRPRKQSPPKDEALKLFPNPAREYVIVDFNLGDTKAAEGTGMLKVSALDGKLIETMLLTKTKDHLVFSLKDYKPGTYVFTLHYGNKILGSMRLIIQ